MTRRNFLKSVAALAAMPLIAGEQGAPSSTQQPKTPPKTRLYSVIYNGVAIGIAEDFSITSENEAPDGPFRAPWSWSKVEATYVAHLDTGFLKPLDTGMLCIASSSFKPVFSKEMIVTACTLTHHDGKFARFHTKFFNQFG